MSVAVREVAFAIPGDIALPTGGYAYDRRVLAALPRHGSSARHLQLPGSFPAPTAADLARTARLLGTVHAGSVLLIDGLAYGAMPAGTIAAARAPIVALVHHPLCLEAGLSAARQEELRRLETAALALARAVIVTSPSTGRLLASEFCVPPDRITVAEPGTDAAPRARGTGGPPRLLAVGSIVPRKGYPLLVEALAGLADRDWRLDIAGADRDAAEHASLLRAIAAAGLGSRIRLLGAVDDAALAGLYDAADVFVLSSLYEGYGMVLAEAMARGLPIVCTTGGAAAETCPDEAAIKVPPRDVTALRAGVAAVIDDAGRRRRMAEASWLAGQRLPCWDDTARVIAGVVRHVVKS